MTTIYYASDVHGAEQCWRKFLKAGTFYGADALIMGGDIAGKAIVPIDLHDDGSFTASFLGQIREGRTRDELDEFMSAVRFNGFYPYAANSEELATYRRDAAARDELFERVMLQEARRWVELGDRAVAETGTPIYVMPGNDDPWAFDQVLAGAERVISSEGKITRIGPHEMISCSYANPTPWNSPRELPEDELYAHLKKLAEEAQEPRCAIFNLHVPPYDSGLDRACEVREDLSMVMSGGVPVQIPVGSHAVRQIIEEYQPLLALHGHIHECKGATRIGRTLCINPGSEYNSGRIHGVLASLTEDVVTRHQFVVG